MDKEKINEILNGIETITIGGEEIQIDPSLFQFDQNSLSQYLEVEAGWYSYYGAKLADAEAEYQFIDAKLDATYGEKFVHLKENEGGSDKLVESKVKQDSEYQELNKKKIAAKRRVKLLQQHIRAWDKNHDNAQQLGYLLRKELDKWSTSDIYEERKGRSDIPSDSELESILNKDE